MKEFIRFFQEQKEVQSIQMGLDEGFDEQLVTGVSGTAKSLLTSSVLKDRKSKTMIVTGQLQQANQLYDDLVELLGAKRVFLYPVNELIAAEMAVSSPELAADRIRSLMQWLKVDNGVLIAPIASLKRMLPPQTYWETYQFTLQADETVDVDGLFKRLVEMGYERVEMVTRPGEFSVRGGIIDMFPITEKHPIRMELFDDEIDSLRYFDELDQRSLEKVEQVFIGPATEWMLKPEDISRASKLLDEQIKKLSQTMKQSETKQQMLDKAESDLGHFQEAISFQGMYKYIELFYEKPASLIDYLPKDGLLLFDEYNRIYEVGQQLDREEADYYESMLQIAEILPKMKLSFDWLQMKSRFTHQKIYMSVFLRQIANTQPANIVTISANQMQEFHGQMPLLKNELERWASAGFTTTILVPNEKRAEKVKSILADYGMESVVKEKVDFQEKLPTILVGQLANGIELPHAKLAILTEKELFNKKVARKRRQQNISNAERIKSYQELSIGDYVVHRNHGIGKYLGIETLKISDLNKDFLLIKYSGDDKLYVPVDQIDLVQKYVGSEGKEPRVYKLGGTEWARVKSRVQSSVEDIADELIKLYAERQAQEGYAFDPDTEMQKEFELSFPYEETDDQIRSIEEIKHDMEMTRPMDRLLCGDVGYGKTEVAIRAAFKAIVEGKQVAFLVPTTILAQQHFQTISERFVDYPINIGVLSRFRTKKQTDETIQGLKDGSIDIVVGTHRVLSKDIVFKDLGLLIVDEEQRFGVKHKETIKQMKTNVDVLTLTATPIPRTLHMSMLGIRDLSVLETPPENRFPIQTYVM